MFEWFLSHVPFIFFLSLLLVDAQWPFLYGEGKKKRVADMSWRFDINHFRALPIQRLYVLKLCLGQSLLEITSGV